jgi:hypothetical protein
MVTPSPAAGDPVIAAAGDIACDPAAGDYNGGNGTAIDCAQKRTAALVTGVDAVLPLGDEQYVCGGLSAFNQSYDPTWGQQKQISHPVPGNHEYQTSGGTGCSTKLDASGYFNYFGAIAGDPTKGYYSYSLGSWHIIALNSELCFVSGGCPAGSPEEVWLKNDLAANPAACTLAYWHEPRFASSPGGGDGVVDPLWQDLYAAGADVVLNGHQHWYERFALQNPSGQADSNGIREFIVGTGGESHVPLSTRRPTSQASNDSTFGVLKMTLHSGSYDWSFVPEAGATFTDSGTSSCHHAGSPTTTTSGSTTTTSGSTTTTSGSTTTTTPTPGTATLAPSDDSYTSLTNPTGTHGSDGSINVNNSGSSERRAYVKFSVTAIPAGATNITATLRLYSQSPATSAVTFTVSQVATAWSEATLTWNNQPTPGSVVTTQNGLTSGAYNSFDVSGLVSGNGTYAMVVTDNDATQRYFSSKESSPNFPPQLQLTWNQPTTTTSGSTTTTSGSTTTTSGSTTTTSGSTTTTTPTPGTATLAPSDDSYTSLTNPTGTHGSDGSINVNNSGSSERRAYVKFSVTAIPAGATNITATLRLYSQSPATSAVTFTVSQVATAWSEATLTWNNQPTPGSVVTTQNGLTSGAYNSFDVSGLVSGNGTYAMVVTDNDATQRYFSSKESSPNFPPQLQLTWNQPTATAFSALGQGSVMPRDSDGDDGGTASRVPLPVLPSWTAGSTPFVSTVLPEFSVRVFVRDDVFGPYEFSCDRASRPALPQLLLADRPL